MRMNVRYMVVKSQSTTLYFTVPSHMNSGSHLITFTTSPFHQEEYTIIVSGEREKGNSKTSSVLTQLELLHLYHVWAVWWSLQKASNNHNIIHPHSWIRRVLTCHFCMYDPTPLGFITTHNSKSGRMEEVASCRQVINNSTQ